MVPLSLPGTEDSVGARSPDRAPPQRGGAREAGLADLTSSEVTTGPNPALTQPTCQEPNVDLELVSQLLRSKYQVLSELGRGGMGVAYLARAKDCHRLVVVKMLQSGCFCTEPERKQFRKEIEAASRLHHPGLVAVREAGEVEGSPYYCMEYVKGPNLVERLRQGPVPAQEAARLVRLLALAVQHAHEQGILHCDLKPSNVLLDNHSEPHVIDFGLARHLGESADQDRGRIVGTPIYMAPEQAAGRAEHVGPAADVYSLGAILYELLAGRPPFGSSTLLGTLRQVLDEQPIPLRQLNAAVPPDMEAICLRCLEKDPGKRYPSAQGLAEDLGRCLPAGLIASRRDADAGVAAALPDPVVSVRPRLWRRTLVLLAWVLLLEHLTVAWIALLRPGVLIWAALLLGGVLVGTLLSAGSRPSNDKVTR